MTAGSPSPSRPATFMIENGSRPLPEVFSTSRQPLHTSATDTSVTTTPARETSSRGSVTANSPPFQLSVALTVPSLFVTDPALAVACA